MWTARQERFGEGRGLKITIEREASPVSYAEVLRSWREDAGFRSFFTELLAGVPHPAFRWETPPISAATGGRPFECVVLDSLGLAATPDPEAFRAHFGGPGAERGVVAFPNLGNDAVLVVPCPRGPASGYGHLAAFVRHAPAWQQDELWRLLGETAGRRLGTAPLWISTAGAGVSWLHVRLDDRPKYYGHAPYRTAL